MALEATLDGAENQQAGEPAEVKAPEQKESDSSKEKADADVKETTVESLARELGWTAKDGFKGNPADYVDAATYIRRSKEIAESKNNQIGSLKKQLKDISVVVNELKTHNEKVYKAEVRRLEGELTSLKAERRTAITDGDIDRVEEIEKKINELHTDATETLKTANTEDVSSASPDSNPDWVAWKVDNNWYNTDSEMTEFADTFAKKYEGVAFNRVLKIVRDEVERVFPEKFSKSEKAQENKAAVNPVEPGTRKGAAKTRFTRADLSSAQKAIMGKFVRQGVMSEEAYIKELAMTGELT